jgi:hypothetical protein
MKCVQAGKFTGTWGGAKVSLFNAANCLLPHEVALAIDVNYMHVQQ